MGTIDDRMNAYEERRQARIDRLEERAAKVRAEGERLVRAGSDALSRIPFGQPILVGHHSERGDRAYRGRAVRQIDKGYALDKQADEIQRRAEAAASNHAISADDPNAPDKLRERIAELEARQERRKAINKILQRKPKNISTPEKIASLVAMGLTSAAAADAFTPDCCGFVGFPAFTLSNNSANIRRLKQRLAETESRAEVETVKTEYDGFTLREDADLNRVQFLFDDKPAEATRTLLKTHGFRWAPSAGAWQRQLNAAGRYAAGRVLAQLTEAESDISATRS